MVANSPTTPYHYDLLQPITKDQNSGVKSHIMKGQIPNGEALLCRGISSKS
jgi:hypothetical protein